MNVTEEVLEIVDENDHVIGLESRKAIHELGLLHREIHIWFVTPAGEIIFQHRAKDKQTDPDKLAPSVGGHVEPGMSYDETAIKECQEETGVIIDLKDLVLLGIIKKKIFHKNGLINYTIRAQYAYLYHGPIGNLKVESGEAVGFEVWNIDDLLYLSEEQKDRFIPLIFEDDMLKLFQKAKKLLNLD